MVNDHVQLLKDSMCKDSITHQTHFELRVDKIINILIPFNVLNISRCCP